MLRTVANLVVPNARFLKRSRIRSAPRKTIDPKLDALHCNCRFWSTVTLVNLCSMYRPSNVRFLKRSSDENIEKFKCSAQLPTPYVNTSGARDDLAWPVLGTAHGEIVEMEIEKCHQRRVRESTQKPRGHSLKKWNSEPSTGIPTRFDDTSS